MMAWIQSTKHRPIRSQVPPLQAPPRTPQRPYVGFSMGGTCMSRCFYQRTSGTVLPVFVQTSPERRHPPPHGLCPGGPPAKAFPIDRYCESCTLGDPTPLLGVSQRGPIKPCPPPTHTPTSLHVYPYPRCQVRGRSLPGSSWP